MSHAIAILQTHVKNCETNAPIHAAEGNFTQAALDLEVRNHCLKAITVLEQHGAHDAPAHPQAVS